MRAGPCERLHRVSMDRPVTRDQLTAALLGALRRLGIANAQAAVDVLGPPDYSVRLFGVICLNMQSLC